MTETFTWCPRVGAQGTVTMRRLVAQFGDGYRQVAADGINNRVQSWPLQFVGREPYITPIKAFLDRHAGNRSFLWTPPLGATAQLFEVPTYSLTAIGGGAYALDATFQQVFKP